MRKIFVLTAVFPLAVMVLTVPGFSQYNRRDVVDIARDVSSLAQNVWNSVSGDLDRRDPVAVRGPDGMQLYLALSSFANSSRVYSDLAARYRNDNILSGGARYLVGQARVIDQLMSQAGSLDQLRSDWNRVQDAVARLSDTYSLNYSTGRSTRMGQNRDRPSGSSSGYGSGTFRWRGRVDGSDYINLQGNRVTVDHLEANPIQNASFQQSRVLPRSNVQVRLNKIRGRGTVELVEQPSSYNNFTAVVLIDDPDGGQDDYEFELIW
jgi:hypothetical protein